MSKKSLYSRAAFCFILSVVSSYAYSQKTGPQYLPPQTGNTPGWFRIFYEDDFINKVNVFRLDSLAAAHEHHLKKQFKRSHKTGQEMSTGEEHQDIYLSYYKRWRRQMNEYVQDKGSLKIIERTFTDKKSKGLPDGRGTSTGWSLLGPVVTHNPSGQLQVPWQANIYACAMAKTNHDIVYAAPETGGVFKTINRGLSWTLALDEPGRRSYSALAVHPADPNTVYAGSTNSIKKTTDGGSTWTAVALSCGEANRIVINPVNPNIIYAACSNGTYKSTNAGVNWSRIQVGISWDIALKTDDPDYVIMLNKPSGGVTSVVLSPDAGASFNTVTLSSEITADGGGRLTVTANDPNRLYVVVLSSAPNNVPYIFKSTTAGTSWALTCTGGHSDQPLNMNNGQGFYDLDIIADPLNADNVIVGTTTAYKSTDGGATFSVVGGYFGPFNIHPDIQCMIADGSDTWIATDGGMNYSSDFFTAAANFSTRSTGIFGTDFWGFTQAWNEDMTGGGKYHNGNTALHENYPAGKAMRLGGGEAATGYYLLGKERHLVFSDIGGQIIPASFDGLATPFSFGKYPNESYFQGESSEIEFLPYCYNYMFTGSGNEFWKSTDGGLSWTSLHDFGSRVVQFEISKSDPAIFYLCTANDLWKSVDTGKTWSLLTLPAGQAHNSKAIALSNTDANTLWITSPGNYTNGQRVFKTTNGGASWINLTTPTINGMDYIISIVHQAGTDGGVYIVGGSGTAYYRNNSMSDWVDISQSLPHGYYPMLSFPFYRDGKLRTGGNRGIWQTDFYEEGVPVAQPTVDKLTTACWRDTFYFDDFSDLKHDGSTTWSWTFSGSPVYVSSTTVRNPKVVFGAAGSYDVALTVTHTSGSSTKSYTGLVQLTANACAPDTVPGRVLTTSAGWAAQPPLNITTNTFTISGWIKPDGLQNSFAGVLFSGSGGASGLNFTSNNRLGYHWQGDPGTYNWAGGPIVPIDQWSHVALVITPTSATIYLNGVGYTRNATHGPVTFNQSFLFGVDRGGLLRAFKGQMDEICIYNRALSQNEMRELMHLTRNNPHAGSLPGNDASLMAYYQFNEDPAYPCYDKVGFRHAVLSGNAVKTDISTAPVGGGVSQRTNVLAGGKADFPVPGVELNFPPTGTYPNGELVITRLNVPADEMPSASSLPNNPASYYVIRNYGTNQTFTALNSIRFKNVQGITSAMVSKPAALELFRRGSNASGPAWGTYVDRADLVTNTNGTGTVEFSAGLNLTGFSQFAIGVNQATLPLKLLAFTAGLQQDRTVLLDWHTAGEANFQGFETERSFDGLYFEKLGFVQAAGGGWYTYQDRNPATGVNYYRLKMVDANQQFTYSPVKKVDVPAAGGNLVTVYPNPVEDGWVELRFGNITPGDASITINNSLGQLVKVFYLKNINRQQRTKFNLDVPAGMYGVRIAFASGYSEYHKLIVSE